MASLYHPNEDLLRQILDNPLEPEYLTARQRGLTTSRGGWILGIGLILVAALLTVGGLQTQQLAPDVQKQRAELIERAQAGAKQTQLLREQVRSSQARVSALRSEKLGDSSQANRMRERLRAEEENVGLLPVAGPGLLITVDDPPDSLAPDPNDRVLDIDIRMLVNGLWEAGAEAISINGNRLGPMTSIRQVGASVAVANLSLARPYLVSAIGNPATLQGRFVETGGGAYWQNRKEQAGAIYRIERRPELDIPGEARFLTPRFARVG